MDRINVIECQPQHQIVVSYGKNLIGSKSSQRDYVAIQDEFIFMRKERYRSKPRAEDVRYMSRTETFQIWTEYVGAQDWRVQCSLRVRVSLDHQYLLSPPISYISLQILLWYISFIAFTDIYTNAPVISRIAQSSALSPPQNRSQPLCKTPLIASVCTTHFNMVFDPSLPKLLLLTHSSID